MGDPASEGRAAQMAEQLFAIADEKGLERALALLSPGVTWTQYDPDNRPAAPLVARGSGEVETLLRKGMAPGMTHRVVRLLEAGDAVACHIECTYDGDLKVECTYVLTLADGLVTDVLGTMCWDG